MTGQMIWDLLIALSGAAYLGMVLFGGIQSPAFGVAFVVVAACELIRLHSTSSKL